MTHQEPETYGVSASSYLRRARERVLDGTKAALFYAALELRCCVEARQAEYIEHLSAYKGQKLRPYRLGENRSKIAKISGGKLIAKLTFELGDGEVLEGYHTPVPASLVRYCEKHLDNLRHAQSRFRGHDDEFWNRTRTDLIAHYRLAWISCQGNMMVPPLWSANSKKTHPMVFEITDGNRAAMERMKESVGEHFNVHVSYLEHPPESWVCDL
ncbi:hypothetical protein [Sphingobium lignivorans]|uniref:Uncharacterized protein n=1 Tax=Sphingobium lignivorans TaxID=2735886 RepID=A0ABR6NEE0_9SPHN|nr:hypothetical protein [Sphingobium lignivorans]MBB5985639.1 hypothetical protein [Sphingobium lignivorans]